MNRILSISLITILSLFSCNNNQTKRLNPATKWNNFELNDDLINKFARDNFLYPENPKFEYIIVDKLLYDLNNNKSNDTIILKKLKGWENDPGDFHQITIKMDNGYSWTETNFEGWVKIRERSIPNTTNQINSNLLMVTEFEKSKILILFGYHFPSEPNGLISIIDFRQKSPRIILNKKIDIDEINDKAIIVSCSDRKCIIEIVEQKLSVKYI